MPIIFFYNDDNALIFESYGWEILCNTERRYYGKWSISTM